MLYLILVQESKTVSGV